MRLVLACLIAVLSTSAWSGPLTDQIESRMAQRLANLTPVATTDTRVRRLQADLDELRLATGEDAVSLVVTPDVVGRVFPGRVVAVNVDLAAMPRSQRMLVLAHELGHVVHRDHERYTSWAVRTEQAMAPLQGEAADAELRRRVDLLSELQHGMEYEADEYASRALVRLGLSIRQAVAVLEPFKVVGETSSHPAVADRVARLLRRDAERPLGIVD